MTIAALSAAALFAAPAGAQKPADAVAPGAPVATATPAPVDAQSFHADIARLYPNQREEIERRGGAERVAREIDAIWTRARSDPAAYLPLLRAELGRTDNPAFFYMDAANLLRSLSRDRADGELALATLTRVPWPLVDRVGYLVAINDYARDGYDTSAAALRWLDFPADEEVMVQPPLHIFYYGGIEAMVFSLFPMEEERFVGALIARLATARSAAGDKPSSDHARRIELLSRQRDTLADLVRRREQLAARLEGAALLLQNMRLDLLRLRSAGIEAALGELATATREAGALNRDIGRALDVADELRGQGLGIGDQG